jgi:hypothetical protein
MSPYAVGTYVACDNAARPIKGKAAFLRCYSSIYKVVADDCIESADLQHERLSGIDLSAPHWRQFDYARYCERDARRIQERPSPR